VGTCLITGGAGFLGINLVRYLRERGVQVVSLDIAPFDYPERDSVKVLEGDIRDAESVRAAMEGVDLVIHAAAALPLYSAEEIYSTDVDGIRNVLDAAYQSGIDRTIHISSTAVYGIPDHHPLKEDDRLHGVGPYGEAKIEAEEICEEFRDKGMCVPIIRPKSFVGPERLGVFALFYDWAKDGKNFPMLGSGRNRYQLLDVEDLCSAIFLAASLPSSRVNDTFNIGATDFATMKEDYQAVLDSRDTENALFRCRPRRPSGHCAYWKSWGFRLYTNGSMKRRRPTHSWMSPRPSSFSAGSRPSATRTLSSGTTSGTLRIWPVSKGAAAYLTGCPGVKAS